VGPHVQVLGAKKIGANAFAGGAQTRGLGWRVFPWGQYVGAIGSWCGVTVYGGAWPQSPEV
jgi:hypothetical protein